MTDFQSLKIVLKINQAKVQPRVTCPACIAQHKVLSEALPGSAGAPVQRDGQGVAKPVEAYTKGAEDPTHCEVFLKTRFGGSKRPVPSGKPIK